VEDKGLKTREPKSKRRPTRTVSPPRLGNEEMKGCGAHLVYHVDKGLSVVPTEVTDHLDLILVREDCPNERDDFVRGEGAPD
jgi:hypothetical protein